MSRAQLISDIMAAVEKLSPERQARLRAHLEHDLAEETYVVVDSPRHCETIEGLVVDGQRCDDGVWDLDCEFVVFSGEGERFRVLGYNCDVTVLKDGDDD